MTSDYCKHSVLVTWMLTCGGIRVGIRGCYDRYASINGDLSPSKYWARLPISISSLTSGCR